MKQASRASSGGKFYKLGHRIIILKTNHLWEPMNIFIYTLTIHCPAWNSFVFVVYLRGHRLIGTSEA